MILNFVPACCHIRVMAVRNSWPRSDVAFLKVHVHLAGVFGELDGDLAPLAIEGTIGRAIAEHVLITQLAADER